MTASDVSTHPRPAPQGHSTPISPARQGESAPPAAPLDRRPTHHARTRRRGDVEGLRAIAVLAVVAFHGAVPWASGGFVGVDVFFVISGYLITGLMLADVRRYGRVRLGDFYARRARRILPLAGVVVIATLLATALIRPPLATVGVARDAVATIPYVSNWWFLGQQTDYLGSTSAPSPLLHFWSLSVEEQFYLGWPLVVLGIAVLFRGRPRRRLTALLVTAAGLAVVSFVLCVWWTATVEPRAYLATETRVWQFMAGALLAIGAPLITRAVDGAGRRSPRALTVARWALGGLGLVLVLGSISKLDADRPYPGTLALLPTVGTALVILAGLLTADAQDRDAEPSGVSWLLARRPMRVIGRLSYAWYLWHWPVVVLVPYLLGDAREPADLAWPALTALSMASVVPAWLSMRLVEDPVRFARAFVPVSRGLLVGAAAVAVPISLAVGVGVLAQHTAERSFPMSQREVAAALSTPVTDAALQKTGSGAVSPAPAAAARDLSPWDRTCFVSVHVTEPAGCRVGDTGSTRRIVLFGDSHAAQWMSPLARIGARAGYGVDLRTKVSCVPADYRTDSLILQRQYRECDVWRERVLAELEAQPPDVVVVAAYNFSTKKHWVPGWDRTLRRILATGARVVYMQPTPIPDFDVPTCLSAALDDWRRCAVDVAGRPPDPVAEAIRDGRYPRARLVDLTRYLCTPTVCPVVRDHVLIYRDRSHLTDTAARGLEPVLLAALEPALRS